MSCTVGMDFVTFPNYGTGNNWYIVGNQNTVIMIPYTVGKVLITCQVLS